MKTRFKRVGALLGFAVSLFLSTETFAQTPSGVIRCYTDQADSIRHAEHPELESSEQFENWLQSEIAYRQSHKIIGGVYQIPVVVHVIHNGEAVGTGTNISYAAIQSQIDVLNEDFRRMFGTNGYNTNPVGADTEIEFCLAQRRPDGSAFPGGENGVNRINRNTVGFTAPPYGQAYIDATIKTYTYNGGVPTATRGWDPGKYMNFWCANLSGGLLGYAQFPTSPLGGMGCGAQADATDGVVMLYNSIGKSSVTGFGGVFNEGRTATHEIGHWLGLRHIWGDGNCTATDYCNDTPPAIAANTGCPTGINTCTAAPDQGPDMIENYMDYTNDLCMNIFTEDQKQRMRAVLEGSPLRLSLINSDACTPPNPSDASVTDVFAPTGDNCVGTLTPSVQLRNRGSNNLTSATISYRIDNGAVTTFAWTGTIVPGANATVALPSFSTTLGQHTFKAYSTLPNGVADPFPSSDTSQIDFVVSNGIMPNYTEDFESGSFPPDNRWNITNAGNTCFRWTAASGVSSTGVYTNNIAQMPCYGNGNTTDIEDFYTPIFLVPCNATALTFKFDVAYRKRVAGSNDRLQVQISTDCGATWTTIYNKSGTTVAPNDLATNATLTGTNEYFPTISTDWRTETLSLMPYVSATSDQVRFRFRGTSNNGNNIFIDNVKFEGTTPGEINVLQTSTDILDGGFSVIPTTQVGNTTNVTYTVQNTGTTNLVLTNPITVTGAGIALVSGFGSTTVAPGGSTTFTISYTPAAVGSTVGNISFATNDCDEGTYNFALNCTGTQNPPVANFTANPLSSCAGTTVTFTNTSINATSYSWNFGPNATPTTSTATNPTVTFLAGTHTITLTATNSFGSDVETKTNYITALAPGGGVLPIVEGFVTATTIPANWSIVNANSSATTWARTTTAGVAPTTGNSMRFDNYTFADADDDQLRVQGFSLNGYTSATMTFDVAYRIYDATWQDGLEVLVSTDCGNTFTSVYNKFGATLATVAGGQTTAFVPTAAQWRNETISLTPYINNPNVIVAFRNLSGNGQHLYIDNVNISGVLATATANFTMAPNPVCQGQTVTFTNTSTGATSYNWNFGAGATPATANTAGPHTVTYSSPGSKTVTLQINGTGPTSTQNLTVNALPATPTITAGGPTTFCTGGSVTLTASAGSSYLWSTGATTASINVTTAGTYTVQVTNASGCQSAASAGTVVTVNPLPATPTITAGGPTTFCAGGSVTLTASAGSSYLWSTGATTASINVTTAGTYTVQVTNASGCQSAASAGTVVTVNALPATPTITAGGPTTFCAGGSVTLTASAGSSYLWSTGATTASINVTTAGTYTVQVTNASGCQSAASAGTVVTVNALPATPTITAGGPTTFCSGGSVTLTSSAGTSYLWSTGATTASINVTTSGTYTVQITNASGCTSAASTGTVVTVNTLPATPTVTAGGPTTFCAGGSVLLTSSAGTSYQWRLNGTPIGGATASTYSATTAGTYTVIVTNASGCSSAASAGTVVTVNALPTTPTITAGGPTTFCSGGSVTLTSSAGSSYLWSTGATTASINVSTAGTYTVQVTNASGCQSAASTGTVVTVNALPATPTITAGGPTTFCSGGSVTLTSSAGSSYLWSTGATTASINVTTAGTYTVQITNASGCQSAASAGTVVTVNPTPAITLGTLTNPTSCTLNNGSIQVNGSGTGNLSWTGAASGNMTGVTLPTSITGLGDGAYNITFTSAAGCVSNTLNGSLTAPTAPAAPTVTAGGPTTFCAGGSVTLTSSAGTSYLWSNGATTQSINVTTAGTYSVTITNASGCTSPASTGTVVTVNALPTTPTITAGGPTTFCAGGSVTLTASAGSSYLWSTGATTASINVTTAGTYTVQITNASGCQSAASAGTVVTVNALPTTPTITAGGPTTFCAGGSVTLTASTGTTYLWSTGATTASINATASGTYTVQVTNASGCQSAASAGTVVTVNPTPAITLGTLTNPTSCTLNNGSIQVNGSGTGNLSWTGAASGNMTGVTLPTSITGLGDGAYNITFTSAAGCVSNTLNGSLTAPTAPAAPTVTAGGPTTFCAGGSVTLTSSTGSSYLWSNGATTQSINVTAGGTYSVTITNASGCTSPASTGTVVTVNSLPATPIISAGGPTTFCTGGSVTLTASTGTTYLWSTGETTQSITVSTGGTYTVQVTNASGCQSAASTGTVVTVDALPSTPTITASGATTFCAGGSVTLTASTGTTYLWSTGATTASINATASGTYTVQITNASGCQSAASAGTVVTVNPTPAITLGTLTNPTSCSLNNGSIQVNGSGTGNLSWTGAASGNMTGVTLPTSITGLGDGAYNITFTSAAGCVSNTLNGSLTAPTAPAAPTVTAGGPTTFCAGGSVTLTSSTGSSYLWSNGATTQSINVTAGGTYSVTITNASGCTSPASSGTVVTVNALPTTPTITAGGPTTFCAGGSVTLTASTGTTYLWSTGETTQSITVSTGGTYTVQVTNASGCQSTASTGTVVTVDALPSTPTITASGATTFCSGGSVTLTASTGTTYLWSTGETTQSITVSTSGNYTVQVTNASGCQSAASSATTVTVNPNPVISNIGSSNPTACGATDGSITILSTEPGDLSWTGTASGSLTNPTFPATVNGLGAGSYTFTVTTANGCVSNSTIGNLSDPGAPATPIITASGSLTFCDGGSVDLTSSSATGNTWSTTETTQTITVTSSGTYSVTVSVAGCSSTSAPVTVVVHPKPIVTLVLEQDSTCLTSPTLVLNGGLPSGGTYSGSGVVSGTFDPSIAGLGSHAITYDLVDGNGCSGNATQNIVVTDCSSIEENAISIALYPNPTSGVFTIESSELIEEVEVFDNFGRIVMNKKVSNTTATIDLSIYADAVYTVKIKSSNSISTQKLTLKK